MISGPFCPEAFGWNEACGLANTGINMPVLIVCLVVAAVFITIGVLASRRR